MSKTIKIGTMPGQISEVALEDNGTVLDALEAANICADGYTIRCNGAEMSVDSVPADGAVVLLTKRVKGNK
jgi:hypothetical protein